MTPATSLVNFIPSSTPPLAVMLASQTLERLPAGTEVAVNKVVVGLRGR